MKYQTFFVFQVVLICLFHLRQIDCVGGEQREVPTPSEDSVSGKISGRGKAPMQEKICKYSIPRETEIPMNKYQPLFLTIINKRIQRISPTLVDQNSAHSSNMSILEFATTGALIFACRAERRDANRVPEDFGKVSQVAVCNTSTGEFEYTFERKENDTFCKYPMKPELKFVGSCVSGTKQEVVFQVVFDNFDFREVTMNVFKDIEEDWKYTDSLLIISTFTKEFAFYTICSLQRLSIIINKPYTYHQYVEHQVISSLIQYRQRINNRRISPELTRSLDKRRSQLYRFYKMFRGNAVFDYFDLNSRYFEKLLYVDPADMIIESWMFSTRLYANVYSQWYTINCLWRLVGESIRQAAHDLGKDITVFAGPLEDLSYNNEQFDIPFFAKYHWKIAAIKEGDIITAAMAFVVHNDIHYSPSDEEPLCGSRVIDICAIHNWPPSNTVSGDGYYYCCNVLEFLKIAESKGFPGATLLLHPSANVIAELNAKPVPPTAVADKGIAGDQGEGYGGAGGSQQGAKEEN